MIEMRVRQQHEIDWRQIINLQAGTLDTFQHEQPIGKVGVDQDIQVGELDQEGCMPDPGDGHFAGL